ncbi:MAG: serine/threonine protein kinase [Myxococcota bacterium]|nr:serine/threonine-protein kinase [Myxococcota bacterium]
MAFNRFPARFGKYIVLDRVSVGGMAEVYRAKEAADGFSRIIAIKRMLDTVAIDVSMVPMFVDEAKLASRLVHPNIAQIFELGRTDGALYIAMELVWGYDLKAIAKACAQKRMRFPPRIGCYIVAKAAEALDFAHNASGPDGRPMRLVHRDVSPQNVMLDYDGEVKVIDFGIAKANAKEAKTEAGVIKGKFSYMAPEQLAGNAVDARTDVFALGIVLYEMLSGERLFDGSSVFSIYEKVVNQPAPRLADAADIPPELDAVVARCLAQDVEERYESAAQLADALAPFLIQDRSIVGRREAQAFMRELFPDDETQVRAKMQRYQQVTEVECVEPSHEVDPAELRRTQVFLSHDLPLDLNRRGSGYGTEVLTPNIPPEETQKQPALRTTEKVEAEASSAWVAVVIAVIALVAALIVVVARSRDLTAMELFEEALRGSSQPNTEVSTAPADAPSPVKPAPPPEPTKRKGVKAVPRRPAPSPP